MRVSARCDYACKALLELTLRWPNKEPIQIHAISEKQDIPMKYLVQILIQLKRLGLVESVRGKQGGYILAKPPHRVSLGGVIRELTGPLMPLANSAAQNGSVFTAIWKEAEEAVAGVLDAITFEAIADRAKKKKRMFVYQI